MQGVLYISITLALTVWCIGLDSQVLSLLLVMSFLLQQEIRSLPVKALSQYTSSHLPVPVLAVRKAIRLSLFDVLLLLCAGSAF